MPDVFTKQKRSEVMSRIRSRGNKETELALIQIFRKFKITGWRRHRFIKFKVQGLKFKVVPARRSRGVRPDFVFAKSKVAVLVDGCFWHGCPKHSNMPVNNKAFWARKLGINRERDRLVNRTLRKHGWRVVRLWEHELRHPERCVTKIQKQMRTRPSLGFKV